MVSSVTGILPTTTAPRILRRFLVEASLAFHSLAVRSAVAYTLPSVKARVSKCSRRSSTSLAPSKYRMAVAAQMNELPARSPSC